MLRLRRAKDISHEPAYLYTQKFRMIYYSIIWVHKWKLNHFNFKNLGPAPVSLPKSSHITGIQNAGQLIHGNHEDELNDAVIE